MNATIEKNELALLPQITALQLFTDGGVRSILDKIKGEVLSVVTDPTTEKGRKEIASLAHKVARTKVAMDEMGKSLTDEQRKFIESINAERRVIVAELDELKDQVRRPLTEYEEREKARVAGHEIRIAAIAAIDANLPTDSAGIAHLIAQAKVTNLDGFDEFKSRAEMTLQASLHRLESAFTIAKEDEDRRAAEEVRKRREEAERLERERLEREQREAQIAAEAAEKARIEAEQKAAEEARKAEEARETERRAKQERIAAAERQKAEAEHQAKEAAERAEREKAEADARHKRELAEAEFRAKEEAERQERNRLAAIEAERVAEEKRAANVKHRKSVIASVASSLAAELHLADELAGAVAEAIAAGKIPNVTIQF